MIRIERYPSFCAPRYQKAEVAQSTSAFFHVPERLIMLRNDILMRLALAIFLIAFSSCASASGWPQDSSKYPKTYQGQGQWCNDFRSSIPPYVAYPTSQCYLRNSDPITDGWQWAFESTNGRYDSDRIESIHYDPGQNLGDGGGCNGGTGGGGGCPAANGAPVVTDPINVATGNKYIEEDEYTGSIWLNFRRFYNSDVAITSSNFGAHWRHSFDRTLEQRSSPSSRLVFFRPDGKQEVFLSTSGQWVPPANIPDSVVEIHDSNGTLIGYRLFVAALRLYETYDVSGRLLTILDQSGVGARLTYSTSQTDPAVAPKAGLLLSVTDPYGRQLQFLYDSAAHIRQVTTPLGSPIVYSYDGTTGDLLSAKYADGYSKQYVYNESSLTGGVNLPSVMTARVDETGVRYEETAYDSNARATSSTLQNGVDRTQVTYASGASLVQYPLGKSANISYSVSQGLNKVSALDQSCSPACAQPWKVRQYDANGYPSSYTDFLGVTTTKQFDAFGLLGQEIEAVGDATYQRTTQYTWDSNLRLPLSKRLLGPGGQAITSEQWIYNGHGQTLVRCEIDEAQASGYTCAASGSVPAGVRRWTYTYCDTVDSTQCPIVGLLLSATGPRTDVSSTTTYSYYLTADESGCGTAGGACHRAGDLYQVADAVSHAHTMVAYDKDGHVVRERDANGVITDSTYHARGWLLTRTVRANADGTPSANDAVTQIGYTPYGAVASVKDPDGVQVTYTYDAAHRLTDITDALGNRIHYTLDAAGNKTKEETFDTSGTLRRSLGRTYNTLGQLTGIKDGLNRTVFDASFSDSYDGNGNLVRSADALGIQRKQGYDALNRLITTIDNYNGTDTATQNTQSVFAYDTRDQLQGVSDPDGLNTTYDYDGLGNATGVHSPDTGTSTFVYDAAGNRIQATDARGVVSHSTYDALNRLTATTYPHSDANVSYRYDEPDSVTGCVGSYPIGRLTSIVETAVTTVYCYDARGNVVKKTQTQGTNVDTVSYTYTLADRLASTRTPDGTAIQYARDGAGRINAVTVLPPGTTGAGAGNVVTNVSYLPFGPIASYTLGNGQTITRTYDANYAVTDVVSPALNLHFARDAMGNITALGNTPGANPAIETYSYDPLYRLTGLKDAQGQAIEVYTYNKTGDRLSKTGNGLATGTYGYQGGTHWLTSIGNSARTYDANGNTTGNANGGDTFGYGYNDRNRMTVVQRNGQTVGSYTYNMLGQRISKVAAADQRFAYDEGSQLLGEYGAASRSYVWLDTLPVAIVETSGAVSALNYVHTDALGTPRAVTDSAGSTVWQWDYQTNSFGEKSPSTVSMTLNLRFPGQYYDAESGWHDNINRSYDSSVGRYGQPDPIGQSAGPTLFGYVGGNPLTYTDSLGLARHDPNSFFCRNLAKKIQDLKNGLDKRWRELIADDEALPEYIGPGEDFYQTRRGHRTIINRETEFLRRNQEKYDRECGPPPPPLFCPQTDPEPAPLPAPEPSPPAVGCKDLLECATH